jgi:hypothetical protein
MHAAYCDTDVHIIQFLASKYVPTTNGRNHSNSSLHQNQKSLAYAWARLQVEFFRFSQRKKGGFKTCSKTI